MKYKENKENSLTHCKTKDGAFRYNCFQPLDLMQIKLKIQKVIF